MSAAARPRVTLKLATSLDGRIALADGTSKWITGEAARAMVHEMRADHDAILTGINTLLADDAQLTARPGGALAGRQPLRAVMDTRLRCRADAAFLKAGPAYVFHGPGVQSEVSRAVTGAGAQCHEVSLDATGRADLREAVDFLGAQGAASLFIEAGGALAGAALGLGLVDRIEWFRAPKLLGGDGRPCVAALGLESLDEAPIFSRTAVREVGDDLLETYERR